MNTWEGCGGRNPSPYLRISQLPLTLGVEWQYEFLC